MSFGTGRSVEEIDEILSAAKLDRKDLLPVSQEITFDTNFSGTDYRLVELDKEVSETIRTGSRLVFRGDANDCAVLCTDQCTYEIKEAETSNSLLILEEISFPEQARRTSGSTDSSASSKSPDSVSSLPLISLDSRKTEVEEEESEVPELEVLVRSIKYIAHSYLELKKINPNLSKIRSLLATSVYKGESAENASKEVKVFMTIDDLLERISASDREIEGYLESIRAIYINGFIRLIDEDYLFRVLSLVISCIDEKSWANDNIIKSIIIESLSLVEPSFILEKVCEWFFQPSSNNDDEIMSYKEYAVCRFLGEVLLKPVGRFNMKEFMKIWQESVPEGLKVDLKQLEGAAVTNSQSFPAVIWHFPEYNLPESTIDRFAVLFETKPKWKLEEITPFLRNLSSATQSVGILLTKFSRVTNLNGIKYYSSKHSK